MLFHSPVDRQQDESPYLQCQDGQTVGEEGQAPGLTCEVRTHAGQEEEKEAKADDEFYLLCPNHLNIKLTIISRMLIYIINSYDFDHSVERDIDFFLYRSRIKIALTTGRGPVGSLGWFIIRLLAYSKVEPPPSKFIASQQFRLCITIANSGIFRPSDPA